MAKDNIYDLTITELILRLSAGSSAVGAPLLTITSPLGSEVQENFNGNAIFTSVVTNIPTGYTVKADSHIITTPTAPITTTGSTASLDTASHSVILGAVDSTYVVTSTVTLEHNTEADIVVNGTYTITSILPMYFGVKSYSASPDETSLTAQESSASSFIMTSSSIGRIYVVLPTSIADLVSITGPSGLLYSIANDFSVITSGSFKYYQLNHDTQLTGSNEKTFTLNFS